MSDIAVDSVADRLRTLAREYSRGQLSFEVYRRERAALLDSLTGPAPPLRAAGGIGREETSKHARSTRPFLPGAIVVCVTIIFLIWHQTRNARLESRGGAGSFASALPIHNGRIHGLVAPLLSDPDWDDARVAAVNAALLEEGSLRIAAEQQTEWFQRFAAEVRRRLKQQQSHDGTLAALAVTIGLDPNALDEPLRPPRPQ